MESEFQKLKLRPSDLSTVQEFDERSTLTKENVKLLDKRKLLQQYVDDEDDIDGDFTVDRGAEFDDVDYKIKKRIGSANQNSGNTKQTTKTPKKLKSSLKSSMNTPMGNRMYTMPDRYQSEHDRESGGSSLSSRTPSSVHSQYSESDTENSDYAADYDEFKEDDEESINLAQVFQQKQIEARKRAEEEQRLIHAQYLQSINQLNRPDSKLSQTYMEIDDDDYDIDDITNDADFENVNLIDPSKLYRFRTNSSPIKTTLGKKKSLPVMRMVTSVSGSPKKVKKYMSTIDMNYKLEKIPKSTYHTFTRYNGDELDDIDNIDDFDLTITLSDYKKLKRKSQKLDFSKYIETPSQHQQKHRNSKDTRYLKDENDNNSKTARLTKEGKIKLIRSLGKPKVRKVMPGHMYGEIVYDPQLKKWCGNEEDLARFDAVGYLKPQLITKTESMPQVVGNMMYDDKKLRWVSVTGNYEDDPFGDEFDTIIKGVNEFEKPKPGIIRSGFPRGVSGKLVPSGSSISLADHLKKNDGYYKVTPEMYKIWKTEESRWVRKVGNWFPTEGDAHGFKYELKAFLNQQ